MGKAEFRFDRRAVRDTPEQIREDVERSLKAARWLNWDGLPKAGDVLECADGTTVMVSASLPAAVHGVPRWTIAGLELFVEQPTFPPKSTHDYATIVRVWRAGTIVWEAADGT